MSYIGNPIVSTDFPVNYFSGNGSTTAFTLSIAPASVNAIDVQVSGVSQSPQTYSVSGTTLTFSAAPPTGSSNIVVRHLGVAGIPNTPSAASVSYNSLDSSLQNRFDNTNKIINGCMRIDQRNSGAEINPAVNGSYYLDRWRAISSQSGKYKIGQNAGSVTPPAGFTKYLGITSLSAYTSLVSGDIFSIRQYIEGFNTADLNWGTANAKTVTLSFQVYSSLTGTFGGVLRNSAQNRTYPFSYTVSSANTWTPISIIIAGDTSGTWLTDNGIGVEIQFAFGAASDVSGTAGIWSSTNYQSATGATSVVSTSGATFYITGVDLRKGSYSTAPTFDMRQYGTELNLCQRYYETGSNSSCGVYFGVAGVAIYTMTCYKATKRAVPSIATTTCNSQNAGSGVVTARTFGTLANGVDGFSPSLATTDVVCYVVYQASAEL